MGNGIEDSCGHIVQYTNGGVETIGEKWAEGRLRSGRFTRQIRHYLGVAGNDGEIGAQWS